MRVITEGLVEIEEKLKGKRLKQKDQSGKLLCKLLKTRVVNYSPGFFIRRLKPDGNELISCYHKPYTYGRHCEARSNLTTLGV